MIGRATNAFIAAIILTLVAGCISEPFSYTEDRCLGQYNQCRLACTESEQFGAEIACFDRCLAQESRCYNTGPESGGTSLAQDALIGRKLSEEEKKADFERYKAQKERDAAGAESAAAAEGTEDANSQDGD